MFYSRLLREQFSRVPNQHFLYGTSYNAWVTLACHPKDKYWNENASFACYVKNTAFAPSVIIKQLLVETKCRLWWERERESIKEEKVRNKFFKWSKVTVYFEYNVFRFCEKEKESITDARGLRSYTLITVISTLNYSPRTKAEMHRDF